MLIAVSRLYRLLLYGEPPKNHGKLMRLGSVVLLKLIPKALRGGIMRVCFYLMRSYKRTGYYSGLYGDYFILSEEWFFPADLVPFEDMLFPVQGKQEDYLETIYSCWYGSYKTLPPVEARKPKHHYVYADVENPYTDNYVYVDFEKPYTEFKGIYYCKEE